MKTIEELQKENENLKQCIEDLVSTKVGLQRKALKAKTNIIKAQAIDEFKSYVKSGLKILNEPSWEGEERLFLFCDQDEFLDIARAILARYGSKLI